MSLSSARSGGSGKCPGPGRAARRSAISWCTTRRSTPSSARRSATTGTWSGRRIGTKCSTPPVISTRPGDRAEEGAGMNVEYHRGWSRRLGQDMELKVDGHGGKPVVVFPCQGGRFFEYEDFGMVGACRPFIDSGAITLFTVDSVDGQSGLHESAHPAA